MYDFAITFKKGDRIQLDYMGADDPDPVPSGTCGTVLADVGQPMRGIYHVSVNWDNGRKLSLVIPPDAAHLIGEG